MSPLDELEPVREGAQGGLVEFLRMWRLADPKDRDAVGVVLASVAGRLDGQADATTPGPLELGLRRRAAAMMLAAQLLGLLR